MSVSGVEILSARPNFHVKDVKASVAFYQDILGFDVKAMMGEPPNFALMTAGGGEIALNQHDDPQMSGCYVYVTGVEALHDHCAAKGATITYPLTLEPWGLLNFVVADPDGHKIAIGEQQEADK